MLRRTTQLIALVSLASAVAACDSGTYVLLTLQAGPKPLQGVRRVDLNLQLGTRTASARYAPGGDITFPTTAALEIASGEGPLTITANALDASSEILDQGSVKVDVIRGARKDATLVFGTFVTVENPDMLPADPCAVCDPNALCTINNGTPSCTCQAGYTGNGMTCTDIDECAGNMAGCSPNATCVNTAGGSRCVCNTGYAGDGFQCTQIWQTVVDADGLDLTREGEFHGGGQRLFFGNRTNLPSAQFFKWFDVTTTTLPANAAALGDAPRPPYGMSANCFEWNDCGYYSGVMFPLNNNGTDYFGLFGANIQYFDTSTLRWASPATTEATTWNYTRRDGATAAALGNTIYYIGGVTYPGGVQTYTDTVTVFRHPSFLPAETTTNYPLKIRGAAAGSARGRIYVFGGRTYVGTQETETPKAYAFNPGSAMWSPLPDMPFMSYRYNPIYAPTFRDRIYIVDTSRSNGVIQVFNTMTNTWEAPIATPSIPNNANPTGFRLASVSSPSEALYLINSWVLAGNVKTMVWKYGL